MRKRIAIVIAFFGDWPAWVDFFVESCRANRDIDWLIFGDAPPPANRSPNVKHVRTSFDDYRTLLSERLGVAIGATDPYKLCDLKPALPFAHADRLQAYDFVGFGDLDVIYGNIRAFYDDALLDGYDLLSSHADRVSGHFCVMRNRDDVITAFQRVPGWKKAFARADHVGFDEGAFYRMLTRRGPPLLSRRPSLRCLFRESYSTPAATESMTWTWKDGRLTNEFYPRNQFMYLHFMSWHSNRWLPAEAAEGQPASAPWPSLGQIVQTDWRTARKDGFTISPQGIKPVATPA